MADYLTNQDLIDRIGGNQRAADLTTDSGSVPDADKITEARQGAEAEFDSYLPPKYAPEVALATYPRAAMLIKSFCLDVAVYRLHSLRPPVPDNVRKRYEDALAWLTKLQRGEVALPADSVIPEATSEGDIADVDGPTRIFTSDNMDGL